MSIQLSRLGILLCLISLSASFQLTDGSLQREKKPKKVEILSSESVTYVGRIHPNQDIMESFAAALKGFKASGITIASAVGSVLHCHLRFANQSQLTKIDGPLEIVSLTGTFDKHLKSHVHIALSDEKGVTYGGHLPSLEERKEANGDKMFGNIQNSIGFDCPIFTTLEFSLLEHKDVVFERKIDP